MFKQGGWVISFFALTLLINASATGKVSFKRNRNDLTLSVALIAGRIWWVPLRVTQIQGENGNLGPTSIAIMESGAIYSISLITLMVLYVKHTYAQNIVLDSMIQIIVRSIFGNLVNAMVRLTIHQGIAFSLVIVRVALGLARAGAIKPQSMQIQQLNMSMKSMVERQNAKARNPEGLWKSGDSPMVMDVGKDDFITCAVEVVQARDMDADSATVDSSSERSDSRGRHGQRGADTPEF